MPQTGSPRCSGSGVAKIPKAPSEPEERFALAWKVLGGPPFEREYRFCPRLFRFDFAWPTAKCAVEIEGGIYEGEKRGRHMRMTGFLHDVEKYNEASFLAWRVWRLPPTLIQPALLTRLAEEIRRCQ